MFPELIKTIRGIIILRIMMTIDFLRIQLLPKQRANSDTIPAFTV